MNSRSFFLSAILGGIIIGLLGNLPVLNLINCVLCLWVWVGGALTILIYRAFQHGTMDLTTGQGAGLGALAGLFGAFFGVIVYLLTSFISRPIFAELARNLDIQGDLSFRTGDFRSVLISSFFFFAIDLIAYPLFGALSGLIATSLMGRGEKPKTGETA